MAGIANAEKREALGRLTSASPYSSIKVSNTSLDHLLLGKAADFRIIGLYFCNDTNLCSAVVENEMG